MHTRLLSTYLSSIRNRLITVGINFVRLLTVCLIGIVAAAAFQPALAATGISSRINYQARLMDPSGFPVADGSYSVKLSLYDAPVGGTRLWTASGTLGAPTAISVSVQNGLFTVLLGDTGQNTLDSVNWNQDALYLGVTIAADSEMTPRKLLASAPQAFNARQLNGMYASSSVFGTNSLFVLNQTSNTAATGTRSTLQLQSSGTSNANDFLVTGVNDLGSTVFSINRQGNATTSNLNAASIVGTSVSSTNLFAINANFATATVMGKGVCLSDGTNCTGSATSLAGETLAQVSNRGSFATSTLQLYGGFITASSTVTSTLTVIGSSTSTSAIKAIVPVPVNAFDVSSGFTLTTTSTNRGIALSRVNAGDDDSLITMSDNALSPLTTSGTYMVYDHTKNQFLISLVGQGGAGQDKAGLTWNNLDILSGNAKAAFDLHNFSSNSSTAILDLHSSSTDIILHTGNFSPEGAVFASAGSVFFRSGCSGGGTCAYLKTGTGVTGWQGIATTDMLGGGTANLQQVTNNGATTSNTLSLFGGFLAASSTVTSTLSIGFSIDFANTSITDSGLSSNNTYQVQSLGSLLLNGSTLTQITSPDIVFGGEIGSDIIPFTAGIYDIGSSLKHYRAGYFDSVSSTDIFSESVTTTNLNVNGSTVCLTNGTNCPASGSSDWVYTATGDFLKTTTSTSNVVIGGTSTTVSHMNSAFALDGNDLYVGDNIGAASSVYTNGEFVAGPGSTHYGNGLISKTDGVLTIEASAHIVLAAGSGAKMFINADTINIGSTVGGVPTQFINLNGVVNTNYNLSTNNFYDLGSSATSVRNVYVSGTVNAVTGAYTALTATNATASNAFVGFLQVTSGTLPTANITTANINTGNVAGTLSVLGDTLLGDNSGSDHVSFTSTINSDFMPAANDTYTMGQLGQAWKGFFSSVTTTNLNVNGSAVCLQNGTNCPAGSGTASLAQVTNVGSFATTTLQLYGGFLAASSTVTSSLSVIGAMNYTATTSTSPFAIRVPASTSTPTFVHGLNFASSNMPNRGIDMFRFNQGTDDITGIALTDDLANYSASTVVMYFDHTLDSYTLSLSGADGIQGTNKAQITMRNLDNPADAGAKAGIELQNNSTASSSAVLRLKTNGGGDMVQYVGSSSPEGSVFANTGSIFFNSNASTSGTQAFLKTTSNSMTGWRGIATTDMVASTIDWRYTATGDFLKTATSTSNVVIGGTSTTVSFMNSAFSLNGNDLFVGDQIGAASSVYTNGEFVAGAGSTHYGDGYISRSNGPLTIMANATGGTRLINSLDNTLRNDTSLSVVSSTAVHGSFPLDVVVYGHYAYTINQSDNSLSVIDVTNPNAPVFVANVPSGVISTDPRKMTIAGHYLYVANSTSPALVIFDISKPSSPTLISETFSSSAFNGIDVSGGFAYLTDFSGVLHVYDVSRPTVPIEVHNVTVASVSSNVVVQGRYAYVANTDFTFKVVDLASTSPTVVGTGITDGSSGKSIAVAGAYLVTGSSGSSTVNVFSISNPTSPTRVGTVNLGTSLKGNGNDMFISGRYAYAVATDGNMYVIDIHDPVNPRVVSSVAVGGNPNGIFVSGRYAYTLESNLNRLIIVDVTGIETNGLLAHSADLGSLQVEGNGTIFNNLQVGGSLAVNGGGIFTQGGIVSSASSTSSTAKFINTSTGNEGTEWGAYISKLLVGNNEDATGTNNYQGVITYATGTSSFGLCIDDTSNSSKCPNSGPAGASIVADGSIVANAFDLAEMYAITGASAPGDLLVLDQTASATVKVSTGNPYDANVIGVVSTKPGFVLGWDGGAQVALTGRVPLNVSMNNGPIHVGDPLVSSNVAGYAMRATRPGMVVGYALEDATATGTIETFVDHGFWAGDFISATGTTTVLNGDVAVSGKFFLPAKGGSVQTDTYLFVDNTLGPTSTYISTNASGFQSNNTYDFAERYYSPDDLETGDLVVVSDRGQSHVQRAMNETDMLVGIVSTQPAFVAGAPATSTYPIALSGRVPTKISNINGAIKAGDPLAPTSIPGVAAKAVKTGPIIGLALDDYDGADVGKIEVNVNPGWWTKVEPPAPVVESAPAPTSDSNIRRGTAKIAAGAKSVHVSFTSLGGYPFVQATPRGLISGNWGTDHYTDTGFDILLENSQSFDVYFSWSAQALSQQDVQFNSDGTQSSLDNVSGDIVSGSTTSTESVPPTFSDTSSTTETSSSTDIVTPPVVDMPDSTSSTTSSTSF